MQATFLGYLDHATGGREPRFGFTIGKAYEVFPCGSSWIVMDDHGTPRQRPGSDFERVTPLRRRGHGSRRCNGCSHE